MKIAGDYMKYFIVLFFIFCLSQPQYAQDVVEESVSVSGITIMDELSRKSEATLGDAVKVFILITGKTPATYDTDIQTLRDEAILDDKVYSENDLLRRGDLALMTARLLKLNDSLLYNIFGSRRYAVTACRAAGFFPGEGGESGVISGGELIDLVVLLSESMGGEQE